jgi:hypothetical protein
LRTRSINQRLVYCLIDAASRTHTLIAIMQALKMVKRFSKALIRNNSRDSIWWFCDPIRPDIFVVDNSYMAAEFQDDCPEALVSVINPHDNSQVQSGILDALI